MSLCRPVTGQPGHGWRGVVAGLLDRPAATLDSRPAAPVHAWPAVGGTAGLINGDPGNPRLTDGTGERFDGGDVDAAMLMAAMSMAAMSMAAMSR